MTGALEGPQEADTARMCRMKHAGCRPSLTTNNNSSCREKSDGGGQGKGLSGVSGASGVSAGYLLSNRPVIERRHEPNQRFRSRVLVQVRGSRSLAGLRLHQQQIWQRFTNTRREEQSIISLCFTNRIIFPARFFFFCGLNHLNYL